MKAIIIEDELLTAEDLAAMLLKLPEKIEVLKILLSVKEALEYFSSGIKPDIIFCDIELGDGHSFEIFKRVQLSVPIIFCTAYDKYALQAFDNNGVGYVLKPFTKKSIKEAVDKFLGLKKQFAPSPADLSFLLSGIQLAQTREKKASTLLVNWKDKIIPVRHNEIALFGHEFKNTFLITKSNQKFIINYTLDELEQMCGNIFYRANRQYLINRDAVEEALQYSARKLFIKLKIPGEFDITVAKAKVPEFLSWLKN
jgi:DNA-binding LytR/AlgR family response regulator